MTFNAGIEAAALKWPNGCHDPDSCSRHKRCMYVQCRNLNRDIKDEIGEAVAEQNTRPSSTAPVEQREAVAWRWRFVDQKAWTLSTNCPKHADDYDVLCEPLYTDAILSLPGSSRDEVLEECAGYIVSLKMNSFDDYGAGYNDALEIAARDIRALKSGVAKP